MSIPRFHLAFPVDDLDAARAFYVDVLGARVGRESDRWIDFDLFGHMVSAHLAPRPAAEPTNPVDGDAVPIPHFGLILDVATHEALANRLTAAGVSFVIAPRTRWKGQPGEQRTMFFRDPAGNALEIKAFADDAQVFAT